MTTWHMSVTLYLLGIVVEVYIFKDLSLVLDHIGEATIWAKVSVIKSSAIFF